MVGKGKALCHSGWILLVVALAQLLEQFPHSCGSSPEVAPLPHVDGVFLIPFTQHEWSLAKVTAALLSHPAGVSGGSGAFPLASGGSTGHA